MTREGGTWSGNFWKTGERLIEKWQKLWRPSQGRKQQHNKRRKQNKRTHRQLLWKPIPSKRAKGRNNRLERDNKHQNKTTTKTNRKVYHKTIYHERTKQHKPQDLQWNNQNKQIPEQLNEGEIIRVYKGNIIKGKCSNERGITISSNMGETDERLYSTTESYRK